MPFGSSAPTGYPRTHRSYRKTSWEHRCETGAGVDRIGRASCAVRRPANRGRRLGGLRFGLTIACFLNSRAVPYVNITAELRVPFNQGQVIVPNVYITCNSVFSGIF